MNKKKENKFDFILNNENLDNNNTMDNNDYIYDDKSDKDINIKIKVSCKNSKKLVIKKSKPNHNDIKFTKPLLKWVGGKTQLLNQLVSNLPKNIVNYHEIFLGGGSMLIAMLELNKIGSINIQDFNAYDLNEGLIYVYKNIQSNKDELLEEINKLKDTYDKLPFNGEKGRIVVNNEQEALESKAKFYYYQRNRFIECDKKSVEGSALFIFINKTCFRGVYREGPNGFNVPFGNYKKTPNIVSKKELDYLSDLIKDVNFECLGYEDSMTHIGDGDFVYLDPPYAPENATSFTSYTSDGFDVSNHEELFKLTKNLPKKTNFMMSNHSVKLVEDSFKSKKYKIVTVDARRAINSKNPGKGTKEVIITNY